MATVYGGIKPEDEYMHPPGPESNFQESKYFNFYDRHRQVGGLIRLANRVNEGYAEVSLCLYLPRTDVLFNFHRPKISSNDRLEAAGMRFDVLEPLVRHRSVYEGQAVCLTDPTQMEDPGRAFRENPRKDVSLDLVHEAVGPVYAIDLDRPGKDLEHKFANVHYEQHMQVQGTLTVDNETMKIDGLGVRDHSWGPRYWQAPRYYRGLTCNVSRDFGFMATEFVHHDGTRTEGGVVVRGSQLEHVMRVHIITDFAPNGLYHRGFLLTMRLESGQDLFVQGVVKSFIPLRNRREDRITYIGEGLTEYRLGEAVGYGLSEYLDQMRQPQAEIRS
jgi:hypothetical protein